MLLEPFNGLILCQRPNVAALAVQVSDQLPVVVRGPPSRWCISLCFCVILDARLFEEILIVGMVPHHTRQCYRVLRHIYLFPIRCDTSSLYSGCALARPAELSAFFWRPHEPIL